MSGQLDTIATQRGNMQAVVATRSTFPAFEGPLTPINPSLSDLSQMVSPAHLP